jgi:hypothetical protein
MCCCCFVIKSIAEGVEMTVMLHVCVCVCLVLKHHNKSVLSCSPGGNYLLIFHKDCTWFRIWLSLLSLFFHRTNLANLPAYMLEDDTGLSPKLQTLAFQNLQSVTNLNTEPLKVVVKKATMRMDVCTSKGVQVTSRSCVMCINL